MFTWNRSNTLALASCQCTTCKGTGTRPTRKPGEVTACNCVLRSIFRACFERFREIAERDNMGNPRKTGPLTWSRVQEEYMADFLAMSKRNLTEAEHRIFRFHFLLGADWTLCCRKLGIDKGAFYHAVYRIQAKLGRAFAETQPYGLFPLDEYFGGVIRNSGTKPTPIDPPALAIVRPPVQQAQDTDDDYYPPQAA